MAKFWSILLYVSVIEAYAVAAPRESVNKIKSLEEEPKLDSNSNGVLGNINTKHIKSENENQRQKRFFDFVGYDYPPPDFSSNFPFSNFPSLAKRDDSHNTGVYGEQDPLDLVFRRLQQIASATRRQVFQQTPITSIPAYIPLFYIPSCGCNTGTDNIPPSDINNGNNPSVPSPDSTSSTNKNNGTPDFPPRFPDLDDMRRNWGVVAGKTDFDDGNDDDGRRPISFEPIPPKKPLSRPVPPVEHGSVQAGAESASTQTSTHGPTLGVQTTTHGVTLGVENDLGDGTSNFVTTTHKPNEEPSFSLDEDATVVRIEPPSICDNAALSCCVQSQVTRECFWNKGCRNPRSDACAPSVVLDIARKYQEFYIKKYKSNS